MTDQKRQSFPQLIAASTKRLRWPFVLLALIGVLLWLSEFTLHVVGYFTGKPYEINHWVLLIGMLVGFVGFFGLDPKRSKEGAGIIVNGAVQILQVLPGLRGRRASDNVVAVVEQPGVPATVVSGVPAGPDSPALAEPTPEDHGPGI